MCNQSFPCVSGSKYQLDRQNVALREKTGYSKLIFYSHRLRVIKISCSLRENNTSTRRLNSIYSFANNSMKNIYKYAAIYKHIVDDKI